MPLINSIEFPEDSQAIILEPRAHHSPAIISYDPIRDIAVYSERLFIMSLMNYNNWFYSDAVEWFLYNTMGCSHMANYPAFIDADGEEVV
jgi:hypothetical protein